MHPHHRGIVVGVIAGLAVGCNSPPVGGEIRLEPPDPFSSDEVLLVVLQDFEDPNGDPLELRIAWTRDGELVDDLADPQVVPAALTRRGEVWAVQVTATDGRDLGPIRTAEVTIRNAPPVVTGITLTPAAPTVNDLLRASATTTDADGDTVSTSFRWEIDGREVPGAITDRLPAGEAVRGETVVVFASADDGEILSSEVASEPVTIVNSAPSITGASIEPTPPGDVHADSTLTCFAEGWDDPDQDAPGYRWSWRVGGAEVGTEQELTAAIAPGDEVTCEVTPDDGQDLGEPVISPAVRVLPGSIYDCDPEPALPAEPHPGRRLTPASLQIEGTVGFDRTTGRFRDWCAADGTRRLAIELIFADVAFADSGSAADLCGVRLVPTAETVAGTPVSFRFDFRDGSGDASYTHYGFTLRSGSFSAQDWRFRTGSGDVVGSCLSRSLPAPWPRDLAGLLEERDWTLAIGEISDPVRDSLREGSTGAADDPYTRLLDGELFGASSAAGDLGPGPLGYGQAYAVEPLTWTLATDSDGALERLDASVAVPSTGRPATAVYDLGSRFVWIADRLLDR